jgi:methionyl-tRNA formyltransferase
MNFVIFGATDLTQAVLEHLQNHGFLPKAIVTIGKTFTISYDSQQVKNVRYCDIDAWASKYNIPCHLYENKQKLAVFLSKFELDVGFVVGWYHLVPRVIRNFFTQGCLGVHASLLPSLRGGAPLNWALLTKQEKTGVTLFELTDEIDAGDIYLQDTFAIDPGDHVGNLAAKAEHSIKQLLQTYLQRNGDIVKQKQVGMATYCLQRKPEDSRIDWCMPATQIDLLVRASTSPYAGAYTFFEKSRIIILKSQVVSDLMIFGAPGQILNLSRDGFPYVVTGNGILQLVHVVDEDGIDKLPELRKSSHKRFD